MAGFRRSNSKRVRGRGPNFVLSIAKTTAIGPGMRRRFGCVPATETLACVLSNRINDESVYAKTPPARPRTNFPRRQHAGLFRRFVPATIMSPPAHELAFPRFGGKAGASGSGRCAGRRRRHHLFRSEDPAVASPESSVRVYESLCTGRPARGTVTAYTPTFMAKKRKLRPCSAIVRGNRGRERRRRCAAATRDCR